MDETQPLQPTDSFAESRKNFLKEKVSPEILEEIKQERERLATEMVDFLLDQIQASTPVKECTDLAEVLGIENQLHHELKENIWKETAEFDITASEAHTKVTQALVTLGDQEAFQEVVRQREKINIKDFALMCIAYAQKGHEQESIQAIELFNFLQPENENQANEFFSQLVTKLDVDKAPEFAIFCYDLMMKLSLLNVPYESFHSFEDTVFCEKIKRGKKEEVTSRFFSDDCDWQKHQKTVALLLQGEDFLSIFSLFSNLEYFKLNEDTISQIVDLFALNIHEKNAYEMWRFFKNPQLKNSLTENVLSQVYRIITSFTEPGTQLSKEITSWITEDQNWNNDPSKVNAFRGLYDSKKFPELSVEYEEKIYKNVEKLQQKASSETVSFWVMLIIKHGTENPLSQKLFDAFEKDTGIFSPDESSVMKLKLALKPLMIWGRFIEAENLIRRKTSHFSFDKYVKEYFDLATQNTKNTTDVLVENFSEKIMAPFLDFSTQGQKIRRLGEKYEKILVKQPSYIRQLWNTAVTQLGLLNPDMTNLFEGKALSLKLKKTGSELYIMTGRNLGVIVNEVPENSLSTWKTVQKAGIPVAPIFKVEEKIRLREIPEVTGENKKKELKRVYSRFCGITVKDYLKKYPNRETAFFLAKEMSLIRKNIKDLGIEHGHPHASNFTVEFWDRAFWEGERAKGMNPNEIQPIHPDLLSFEPETYEKDKQKWIPVIRLIDWDQADSSPKPS